MDPNETLRELIALSNKYQDGIDFDLIERQWENDHDVMRMCELIQALDGWIKGGGFLPKRWERKDGAK